MTQHFVGNVNDKVLLAAHAAVGNDWLMANTFRRWPAKTIKAKFAERLRFARGNRFDSAAEFARAAGFEEETYRRWERGETEPGVVAINTILQELDVSADYLVTGDIPPKPRPKS